MFLFPHLRHYLLEIVRVFLLVPFRPDQRWKLVGGFGSEAIFELQLDLANYLANARKPTSNFKAFAKISGSARHSESGEVEFSSQGPAEALHGEAEGNTRALLLLNGATANVVFEDLVVELPTPPSDARYLEVGVEFTVGETVEATVQQNDCLDVDSFRSVNIALKDQEDNPLPFEPFVVKDATGAVIEGVLDDKGEARVSGLRSTRCDVEFPNSQRVDVIATGEV